MSDELKLCPFCGGEAFIKRMGTNRVSMQIECDNCGCELETGETWIDEHSDWNTRAQPTITDYLKANEPMLTKTKAKMVSVESLREFAGIKDSDND